MLFTPPAGLFPLRPPLATDPKIKTRSSVDMGRGDKRTAKGKRKAGTFGISRPRNAELRQRREGPGPDTGADPLRQMSGDLDPTSVCEKDIQPGASVAGRRLGLFDMLMSRSLAGFPATAKSVEDVLTNLKFPEESPFTPQDFNRQDESTDTQFYDAPRFCFHVDDAAVAALTQYYSTAFRAWDKPEILDICASHVSHFPEDVADYAGRRVALGMNEVELSQNKQVSEYVVKDLNADPTLPFEDNSFDIVTNVVSIDYLTQPLQISKEVARVLKPGGAAIFALSNRCFPTKAVNIWLKTNDLEHVYVVGSYFHYAGGFKPPSAVEVSPNKATTPWAAGKSQNIAYLAVVKATVDK